MRPASHPHPAKAQRGCSPPTHGADDPLSVTRTSTAPAGTRLATASTRGARNAFTELQCCLRRFHPVTPPRDEDMDALMGRCGRIPRDSPCDVASCRNSCTRARPHERGDLCAQRRSRRWRQDRRADSRTTQKRSCQRSAQSTTKRRASSVVTCSLW